MLPALEASATTKQGCPSSQELGIIGPQQPARSQGLHRGQAQVGAGPGPQLRASPQAGGQHEEARAQHQRLAGHHGGRRQLFLQPEALQAVVPGEDQAAAGKGLCQDDVGLPLVGESLYAQRRLCDGLEPGQLYGSALERLGVEVVELHVGQGGGAGTGPSAHAGVHGGYPLQQPEDAAVTLERVPAEVHMNQGLQASEQVSGQRLEMVIGEAQVSE